MQNLPFPLRTKNSRKYTYSGDDRTSNINSTCSSGGRLESICTYKIPRCPLVISCNCIISRCFWSTNMDQAYMVGLIESLIKWKEKKTFDNLQEIMGKTDRSFSWTIILNSMTHIQVKHSSSSLFKTFEIFSQLEVFKKRSSSSNFRLDSLKPLKLWMNKKKRAMPILIKVN